MCDNLLYPNNPIVIIDDETVVLDLMKVNLNVAGYSNVQTFENCLDALTYIENNNCELVLLDITMGEMNGLEVLKKLKEIAPDLPVIMVTGVTEIEVAVTSMKEGAVDYILKPIDNERIISSIANVLKIKELSTDYIRLKESMLSNELQQPQIFSSIITQNCRMLNIFKYIEAIAPTAHPVLITGETGTGKELIAKAVHDASRLHGRFVAVNVAGLDDNMFSDTLFGHCKGAFTGADTNRCGMIESADNGTLFLDEIGDLTIQSQVKLLRLLQQREYFPIGSDRPRICTARIVAATSREISELEKTEVMRKDLFYRLRTHHIHLPPLRERKDDLQLLVTEFVKRAAMELNKAVPYVPNELIKLLNTWRFPGNVRELEGMINDAISVHQNHILSLRVFKERLGMNEDFSNINTKNGQSDTKVIFQENLPTLEEMENLIVNEAYDRAGGNQTIAADLLGITRQSLSYRLKRSTEKKMCN